MSQPATSTDVPQNAPQPAEIVQTGLMLTQIDGEAAAQQTIPTDETEWQENVRTARQADNQPPLTSELTQDVNTAVRQVLANAVGKRQAYPQQRLSDSPPTPQTTSRSVPQQSLADYGYTFQTPSTQSLNTNTIDPRLFEESCDPEISPKQSFTHT